MALQLQEQVVTECLESKIESLKFEDSKQVTSLSHEQRLSQRLHELWNEIYVSVGGGENAQKKLDKFISRVKRAKLEVHKHMKTHTEDSLDYYLYKPRTDDWYQHAVIYCLYVDLFSENFQGLIQKLDYLQELGVTCLWLLPILDSPMKDQGFDIRNYHKIRSELVNNVSQNNVDDIEVFRAFVKEAHKRKISVILDIALNHSSDQHPWFQEAVQNPSSEKRNYYIWNSDKNKYKETRIIFEGICDSNWTLENCVGREAQYYFHRFMEAQPDFNYKNPDLLLSISEILLFWMIKGGVDGFRADAVPFIWKEDNTNCESLPQVHSILKFFRTVLDYVRSGTIILAEACQQPKQVVNYFGNDDECHAAYHFPLMVQLWHSLAIKDSRPILKIMNPEVTPLIPDMAQWFTFLRCHDELTLEMSSDEERVFLFKHYCKDERWGFREGQGITARLSDLLNNNVEAIQLAHSLLLTIIGTPILFYGDEVGKQFDEQYYNEMHNLTKINDKRYYNRGKMEWDAVIKALEDKDSFSGKIFHDLRRKNKIRNTLTWLGCANLEFEQNIVSADDEKLHQVLAFSRIERQCKKPRALFCLHNLGGECEMLLPYSLGPSVHHDLLGESVKQEGGALKLRQFGHYWFHLDIEKKQLFV